MPSKFYASEAVRTRLAGPAILLVLVVLFNWKLVLTDQYTWLEGTDLSYLVLPWFQFQAGEWHHGRIPLWDPTAWFGQPLLGQGQPGAAYPPNWLLFLVPLKHGWIRQSALHWYYVLIHYFAALTAYALARDLKRSRTASILAGCIYALGGYVISVKWPQMLNGAVWSPLVLMYLFRAERGEKPLSNALLSGFFLGFGWLAGHHQMNLLVSLAVGALWLWVSLHGTSGDERGFLWSWHKARLGIVSLGLALLASGFQTVPMAEYGRLAVRWVGSQHDPLGFDQSVPYSAHEPYALRPDALLGIFVPRVESAYDPYIGLIAFTLAILGAILAWKQRHVRWLVTLSLAGLLFALGPNSILHGVIYSLVPLVEKARVPAAGIILFSLGIAPLAAFGLDLLPRPDSAHLSRRAGTLLVGIAGIAAVITLIFYATKMTNQVADGRLMIVALGGVLGSAVFAGWRNGSISSHTGAVCLIGLVLFELGNATSNYYVPNRDIASLNPYLHLLSEHSDLVDFVHGQDEAVRVDYDDQQIPYNIGDWYGLETAGGYLASVPENIWHMDVFTPRGRNFFGVKYYFGKTPPGPGFNEVFQGKSGVKIFENQAAFPRVWSVHQITTVPDAKLVTSTMAGSNFDPRISAILVKEKVPGLGTCGSFGETVYMRRHTANDVYITANLRCPGMVILTDTWFPGWRATVDGNPVRIYETYGGVRGVIAGSGTHEIQMHYRPMSIILGALMTALATLITAVVVWRSASDRNSWPTRPVP
jgi:hypothetical protein